MPRQKYACRIVTNTGNAFEMTTYMDEEAVKGEIARANEDRTTWARFDGITESDENIAVAIDPSIITGYIHSIWHAPTPKPITPTIVR